jgi:hypothetical protein
VDLGQLAKDKRLQIVAGAGALAGVVVLVRKKSGGGADTGGTSSTTGSAGSLGTYDSSGIDAYQNLNNELNAGIQAYSDQLTDIQKQLAALTPKPSTSGGGTHTPPPHPTPKPSKNTAKNWGWFTSKSNRNTPAIIAKKYGISLSEFYAWNPQYKGKKFVPAGAHVKVRAKAGPYRK